MKNKCCEINDMNHLYICICCGKITCNACTYLTKDGQRECQECGFINDDNEVNDGENN